MTARPIPVRHYGDYPLPTGADALDEPFVTVAAASPTNFARVLR